MLLSLADTTKYKGVLYWAPFIDGFGLLAKGYYLEESCSSQTITEQGLVLRVRSLTRRRHPRDVEPITDPKLVEEILVNYLFPERSA